jgi:hypothetical protein
MKANGLIKVSKSVRCRLIPLAIAITSALVTQPLFAQVPIHNIVLTEKSSTSLVATYDGSTTGVTVTFQAPDQWLVTFPTTVSFGSTGRNVDWIEPDNSSLGNAVSFFPEVSNVLGVSSDTGTSPSFSPTPDESTVNNVGSDSRGGSISANFDDDGDARAVPEAGSAFGLLFLSLAALWGANRFSAFSQPNETQDQPPREREVTVACSQS